MLKKVTPGKAVCVLLSILMAISAAGAVPASADTHVSESASYTSKDVAAWLDARTLSGRQKIADAKVDGQTPVMINGAILLKPDQSLTLQISIADSAAYDFVLEYQPINAKLMDAELTFSVDKQIYNASVPLLWTDQSSAYNQDPYGNDLIEKSKSIAAFYCNRIVNEQAADLGPVSSILEPGEHMLSLKFSDQQMLIRNIYVVRQSGTPTYQQYLQKSGAFSVDPGTITLEAEKYALKSDSFLHAGCVMNASLTPYDVYHRKNNVIDGNSWSKIGQKIEWSVNVGQTGYYKIGFHYNQPAVSGKPSYRSIEIDGDVPYQDLEAVPFQATTSWKYENLMVTNQSGKPFLVYLTKGRHTLAITAVLGPFKSPYDKTVALMDQISQVSNDLQQLTGGITDRNRTWDMNYYLPSDLKRLRNYAKQMDALYQSLLVKGGKQPSYVSDVNYALKLLNKLLKSPETLPNKMSLLSEGDNSVNKYLENAISAMTPQPLSLDRIYLYGSKELPKAHVSWITSAWNSIRTFLYSFSPKSTTSDYSVSSTKKNGQLQVWINRPVQYVQVLQQLVDSDYNKIYHANVRLSVMPNEQKLILANASGSNPDVALSVNYYTPFDFAVRGAAKNLLDYPDFLSFYNNNYNLNSLEPMCYQGGVYGTAETQDFQVLFYRKDILKSLGLPVPKTWDDVKKIMPVLLRHSMNFNIPLADTVGFKPITATSPFIFQNNGSVYSTSGTSVAFTSDNFKTGFEEMTDLFKIYGAQMVVPNFYNSFRYGQTPLGISGFSTYLQLKVAAPELTGKWGITLAPGELQKDGTILRYQSADLTGCMIFKNTKNSKEAWQFLKWWLSEDTQTQYSYYLESALGPEYRWNTANILSFAQLPYSQLDRTVILDQWKSQKETMRHPANYMVERDFSNAWNDVVINGRDPIETLDQEAIDSDREIFSKLQEFGYYDQNGKLIKSYDTDTINKLRKRLSEEGVK